MKDRSGLRKTGMHLDLGGLGKGYVAQAALNTIQSTGFNLDGECWWKNSFGRSATWPGWLAHRNNYSGRKRKNNAAIIIIKKHFRSYIGRYISAPGY